MGAAGSAIMNLLMGLVTWQIVSNGGSGDYFADNLTVIFSALYAVNMYFQSFGAVAIVKCNAPWFHVNERGIFGAIFGILISLGIYFAFDVGYMIIDNFDLEYVFLIPTFLLACFWVLNLLVVKNTPGEAGYEDFDTADASSGDEGPQMGAIAVLTLMLKNPVIMTIACIEFCSGFLRQAIMQWFRTFAKQTNDVLGMQGSFVYDNWGLLLCCAGILGGVFSGVISDRVFQSRRGPVAAILYAGMLIGSVVMAFFFKATILPWLVVIMSMFIIGVHGMLSGTASMDFGGKKNVGVAVGIIDGFVYAGTAVMSITYGFILPNDAVPAEAANPDNWIWWPVSMIPVALIGFYLSTKVWNAKPTRAVDAKPAT
jgi:OPA family glycerol-3-phosphate transporter-like MFS transporter